MSNKDKVQFKELSKKPYDKMTPQEKQEYIKLGAKDFTKRYSEVIKKLAKE